MDSFFKVIGLEDLSDTNYSKLGMFTTAGKLFNINSLCSPLLTEQSSQHCCSALTLFMQLFYSFPDSYHSCTSLSSGSKASNPGEPVGNGLTQTAANDLGLWEGMPVGTSLIDAHAGGLGESGNHSNCMYTHLLIFFLVAVIFLLFHLRCHWCRFEFASW